MSVSNSDGGVCWNGVVRTEVIELNQISMETNNYSASSIPNNCEKYLGQFYKKCYGLSRPFILASLPFGCKLPTISSQPDSWNSFLEKSIIPKN